METVPAKTIITRTAMGSSWFGCDYNMNLYRGCCHGCIYCDSRSDCYQITDFDTVRAKADALQLVRDELRKKVKKGIIATGAMSDPYNPFEGEQLLTRHALELVSAFGFGIAIATKSNLVARDSDVLAEIAKHAPAIVKMTVTTADDALAKRVEPFAPLPSERFAAVKRLSERGIFTGILLMPVLPWIEDSDENVLAVVRAAAVAGARFVYPAFGVTMRGGNRQYFYDCLDREFPGLRKKYEDTFGRYYQCTSPRARKLWPLFTAECCRLGILYRMSDIIRASRSGYHFEQLSLF